MKTLRLTIFALGLLLVVSAAKAQSTTVAANIPFDFVVGKHVLPAGQYTMTSLTQNNGGLAIRSNDNAAPTQLLLTQDCKKLDAAKKTVLLFHRLGDEYFLSEIWVEGSKRGRSIPRSSIEKQMAMNHGDQQEVIVAALITQ
jgi:hypothetical protein